MNATVQQQLAKERAEMQQLVERQATVMVVESVQWQQLEAKRLAIANAWGKEWRQRCGALAAVANAWIPMAGLAIATFGLGTFLGINLPRGVVCLSGQPWCAWLRVVPMETVVEIPKR